MESLKGKRLLILGGTTISCEIIRAAKKMGVHTVVTDYYPPEKSPGKRICDEWYMVSCTDTDAVAQLVKEKNIQGIIVGFSDMLLPYYARICEKTGLPCYGSYEQFVTFTDKKLFKELCTRFTVETPREYVIDSKTLLPVEDVTFPVLVKPADNSGSRGISVCRSMEELRRGVQYALELSQKKQVIAEEYIEGGEATAFWLFKDGEYHLTAIADRHVRNDQGGVIPLPVCYTFPSKQTESYGESLLEGCRKMFSHCGIKNGMMFMQCKTRNGKCIVYDVGYRLTGTLEYKLLEKTCGYDPLEMLITFALTGSMGESDVKSLADPMLKGKYAFNVSLLSKPGKIARITGLEQVMDLPGIIDAVVDHEEGEEITASMVGLLSQITVRVFGTADSRQQAGQLIKAVNDTVDIISDKGESLKLPGLGEDAAQLFP